MASLISNIIIAGKIKTKTGLLIGSSAESIDIGGIDKYVMRDPASNLPYIPGSSLKGKMRMLTEYAENRVDITNDGKGKPCDCGECMVCIIYGNAADSEKKSELKLGPTRLLIRDAYPTPETIEMWENIDSELMYTEYKGENTIDRLTSQAMPRFFERVVPESVFDFELVYSVYDFKQADDIENIKYVLQALKMLEHNAIGGHGSRGYGKIEINILEPFVFTMQDYKDGLTKIPDTKNLSYIKIQDIKPDDIIRNLRDRIKQ